MTPIVEGVFLHTRMAHGGQGKRATPRQRSGRWNVGRARDCLHCKLYALGRMFLEELIDPSVRCTHGQAPQQPCHYFSVAQMRRRTSGVAGDVPCEHFSRLFCFTSWHFLHVDTAPIGRLL
ncbi:hypothetical protein TcCL_ESM07296 [Trypanosoma cruzi]|nr:hypothetical protein TcCL_ESM07296 [Trypanosoma cruzi]